MVMVRVWVRVRRILTGQLVGKSDATAAVVQDPTLSMQLCRSSMGDGVHDVGMYVYMCRYIGWGAGIGVGQILDALWAESVQ